MNISKKGIELIKKHEGCRLEAYLCPAGVSTIGYGHTQTAKLGMKITQEKADMLLMKDISIVEKCLAKVAPTLNENQFDALVSLGFNIGIGGLRKSTMMKIVKENPNSYRIRREFMKWVYVRGEISAGLSKRREDEANYYGAS